MQNIFARGRKIIFEPQSSILSGAVIIMALVILSLVLGLVRQRVMLSFFSKDQVGLFLAAFRLPDLVFEVLAYGAFSSAFIPVFVKQLKLEEDDAWNTAGRIVNIGLLLFLPVAALFILFARPLYNIVAPGFTDVQTDQIANLSRIIILAQGVFIVSYIITGVLESSRRFFVPALAPLVYNIGMILGTVFLAPSMGLMAPAFGVLIGAVGHFLIQLPLAYQLGFRFIKEWRINGSVKLVGKLAAPRVLELSILQILKTSELTFASVMSAASYTYLNLANSLQSVPINLFGVSLAKAALPVLTRDSDDPAAFRTTFLTTLYQMMFFIIPITTLMVVLRVPLVRLVYGTNLFDWDATVTTGLVLSAYAVGIPIQAALTLISRAYYALHDTKTPVKFAILDVALTVTIQLICVFVLHLPVWSLALANSIAGFLQITLLYYFLSKKLHDGSMISLIPVAKSIIGALTSGATMFFILKTFDRSAWVKRLSFINSIDALKNLNFEHFVLDTRYTFNLITLTAITAAIGILVYIVTLALLRSNELLVAFDVVKSRTLRTPQKEREPITTTTQSE